MLGNFPPFTTMQELNLDWILTKIKNILRFVPDDGAVGQILRRTPSGAEWSDEQGAGGSVTSVNGMQGAVVLTAADVDALPDTYVAPVTSVNGMTGDVVISGGGAVDSVNGQTGVVVLDAADVGALPGSTVIPDSTSDLVNDSGFITSAQAPVQSVNGQTGAVSLTIPDSTSDLVNDSGFVNAADAAAAAPVQSVNGQTGAVALTIPSILSKAISSTTDGTGDINLQLDPTQYMPIGFIKTSPLNTFFVYSFGQSTNGQTWWIKLLNDSAGNLANTSVSGTLYYIEV